MLYDLSGIVPFLFVFALLALAGAVASIAVIGQSLGDHRRDRLARHESIPTYYRRHLLAH